jgi:redox-sensitive bicupin YhaK (pirin superfamily)
MIETVIHQHRHQLGNFEIGRVLPSNQHRSVGPFIFFDHIGPMDLAQGLPRSADVRPHPHIGLSTVSYLYSGEIMHRDNLGNEQAIRPGEVNWMLAGRGITHSERFEKARLVGDRVHGIQAWVGLPEAQEEADPSFAHHAGSDLPEWNESGLAARLIAGSAYGAKAKVQVHSPLFYVHLEMTAGARTLAPEGYSERALYVASGAIECGPSRYSAGQMLLLGPGPLEFSAVGRATVMLLGGEPLGLRHIYWNFASSSRERIEQAKADWAAGRMRLPAHDDQEFIPLPT